VVTALAGCGSGDDPGEAATVARAFGAVAHSTFTAVAAGDIAQCFDAQPRASAAAKSAALVTPDDAWVLTLGDNAYPDGKPKEFAGCFGPTWGAFKDPIRPAIGNRESHTPNADGYFGYFGEQAGPDRRGYYSFDYGGWHFISLNSLADTSTGSEQYRWLIADLENSRGALCAIAYWHYPLFNSGARHGGYPRMKAIFKALYDAGVDIVLAGDEHVYERFAPQTADGVADPQRGIRQFIVGTGGGTLYEFGPPVPNSETRIEGKWGILRLRLGEGEYSWQFVPAGGGAALDAGTDTCHH
jgi:hypothetical protein